MTTGDHDGGRIGCNHAGGRCSDDAIRAAAWSEGYHHGVEDMTDTETLDVARRNPYRIPEAR